jgi:osmoprotectant transport system permease protein
VKVIATILITLGLLLPQDEIKPTITVGAKHFTEGYIISEIIAQLLENNGYPVIRKFNLGGTMVCYEALRNNAIDIYPEYTGTITRELLKLNTDLSVSQLAEQLQKQKIGITSSFGFNNSYGLVVTKETADAHKLRDISDLTTLNDLNAGISYEFLKRKDGWDVLAKVYALPQTPVGIEHGLAYDALINKEIAITDCYTTDGELSKYPLIVLNDDRNFFPAYEAVALYRTALPQGIKEILDRLTNTISEEKMSSMNLQAISKKPIEEIAAEFLKVNRLNSTTVDPKESNTFLRSIARHLLLTFIALITAMVVAVPLGVLLYWNPKAANPVLYAAGLLQTIPSIALLAFMIPLFGIGLLPAVVALFLYALLPILRNTVTGLRSVDPLLKEIATSLGMTRYQALRIVEGPLAMPTIITGIRIAAVISVGTATLAAFIGAGGLGEYIVTGLALNNTTMILQGAGSAAVMAILIEICFEVAERTFSRSPKRTQ